MFSIVLKPIFAILKPILENLILWFVKKFVSRIRLWDQKEWDGLTPKEKLFIWYKHHWGLKNQGSGEVDQVTAPIKEAILYGGIIILVFERILETVGIQTNVFTLMTIVAVSCGILWLINFTVQWMLGDWMDRKDLIALKEEIVNRRNLVFREIRRMMKSGKVSYNYKSKKT